MISCVYNTVHWSCCAFCRWCWEMFPGCWGRWWPWRSFWTGSIGSLTSDGAQSFGSLSSPCRCTSTPPEKRRRPLSKRLESFCIVSMHRCTGVVLYCCCSLSPCWPRLLGFYINSALCPQNIHCYEYVHTSKYVVRATFLKIMIHVLLTFGQLSLLRAY